MRPYFLETSQTIYIKVVDHNKKILDKADCTVQAGPGNYLLSSNPGIVNLPRGKGPLLINGSLKGYQQLNVAASESFNGVT